VPHESAFEHAECLLLLGQRMPHRSAEPNLQRGETLAAAGYAAGRASLGQASRQPVERLCVFLDRAPAAARSDVWSDAYAYTVDAWQRTVLFWDALRQRGDIYLEHRRAGKPPVLRFPYEILIDGRTLEHPVNYALLRILPRDDVPEDAYSTAGNRGQYVIVVPSHDVVIVRRGLDYGRQGFNRWDLTREVLKAIAVE